MSVGRRPRARMKLGRHLVGLPPWRSMPHGVVVYEEWDPEDKTTYTWEEWEVLGYENLDFWVEYDHYTNAVTLYRPMRVAERLDPSELREGQELVVTFGGYRHDVRVHEVGVGRIASLDGAFTYDLTIGQEVAYAELKGQGFVLSVERFDERVLDVYHGIVLDTADQKAHFGKRVARRRMGGIGCLVLVVLFVGMVAASCVPVRQECTPRTVTSVTGQVTTQEECHMRPLYGGGGSGVGK
ncbi:hypothetical protein KIN34_03150 [Cellulomonas sp. DKR-3]|uniref:DUF4178 domain-containing protein n=1 Tax=Cellulomonas fulva TaxID=2835530 RepID=A0ABS5TVU4_9CELL|nr:hypothetical protein [Cellulomonas fulva]MBT0993284.1 hypothetical protein [Cellulomonas fulva]